MDRVVGLAVLSVVVCLPALASEPGQPIDVDDWEIFEPSLHASTWLPRNSSCVGGSSVTTKPPECHLGFFFRWDGQGGDDNAGSAVDASGVQWVLMREDLPVGCPVEPASFIWKLISCSPSATCTEAAQIPGWRCAGEEFRPLGLWIDSVNGYLYLRAETGVWGNQSSYAQEIHRFSGLPTAFEILQTYAPGPLSFRVPYMPEGFQHAEWFDTYYGDLATVGDWSQAQPFQCGYPATAPETGDYLTVEDTLPTPAPGRGYYYVTAVNYQGQRRYGRQANGGVLTGRDSAVLPECNDASGY